MWNVRPRPAGHLYKAVQGTRACGQRHRAAVLGGSSLRECHARFFYGRIGYIHSYWETATKQNWSGPIIDGSREAPYRLSAHFGRGPTHPAVFYVERQKQCEE